MEGKRETVRVIAVDCHVKTDSYWSVFQHFNVWYSENLSEMLTWLGIFYIRKRDLFDSPMKIKICFKLAFFPVTWGHSSGVKRTWEIKENTKEKQGKDGKNLNSFIERWSNVPYSPLTEATFIEIENLRKHMQKGCLSEIPVVLRETRDPGTDY